MLRFSDLDYEGFFGRKANERRLQDDFRRLRGSEILRYSIWASTQRYIEKIPRRWVDYGYDEGFFKRAGINQLKERDRVEDDYSEFIEQFKNLKYNEVLIIDEDIEIIPDEERFQREYPYSKKAVTYKKWADLVSVARLRSRKAVSEEDYLQRRFKERVNMIRENIEGCGFSFWGTSRSAVNKKFSFVNCLEGVTLYNYISSEPKNGKIEVEPYIDASKEVSRRGGHFRVKAPSRSEDKMYEWNLMNVAIGRDYANLYDLTTTINTTGSDYDRLHYRFSATQEVFTAQDIAAYLKIMELSCEDDLERRVLLCPFLIPNKEMFDFYNKLTNNVVKFVREEDAEEDETLGEDENIEPRKVRARALNQAELDKLLFKKLAYLNKESDGHAFENAFVELDENIDIIGIDLSYAIRNRKNFRIQPSFEDHPFVKNS